MYGSRFNASLACLSRDIPLRMKKERPANLRPMPKMSAKMPFSSESTGSSVVECVATVQESSMEDHYQQELDSPRNTDPAQVLLEVQGVLESMPGFREILVEIRSLRGAVTSLPRRH